MRIPQPWMNDCGTCRAIVAAVTAAEADTIAFLTVRHGLAEHLSNVHADRLPDYQPACADCAEAKRDTSELVMAGVHDRASAHEMVVLEQEAQWHRATHLLPDV